jgi:hypothetical protein
MKEQNACIVYISSRKKCIRHSLKSLWDNFNHKHRYPVYVHYFDDIYDDESFRQEIREDNSQDVRFISVPYKTPENIREEELFYNRKELWYARTSFPINRKGYLHMCNFTSNMYGYPDTNLTQYDFILTHDDESGYDSKVDINPFSILREQNKLFGAYKTGQRLKNGRPHQGHLDTRVGLWQLTKRFLELKNLTPKNEKLASLLTDPAANNNFHLLDWCDTYVIDTKMFKSQLWKEWIGFVNKSGGIYKYRWGDNEIISLFVHMIQDEIYDFNLVDSGVHNQGKFRHLQDIAPGVKDLTK